MRNSTIMTVIAALCMLLASCQKEGVYNPKKKIDRVSYSSSYLYQVKQNNSWITMEEGQTPKYVNQTYAWNGKQLKSISFYDSDGELSYTDNYTYDKNRLTSISWGGSGRYEFVYDNGKISTICYYYGNDKENEYVFTHSNGKISQIEFINYGAKSENHPLPEFMLNLPTQNGTSILNQVSQAKGNTTWSFEWDGNNVSKITYDEGSERRTYEYTYDNKLNPMYGMFEIDEFGYDFILSKNNVTSLTYKYKDDNYSVTYTYEYDGKFPTTRTCTYTDEYTEERYIETETMYFDYK